MTEAEARARSAQRAQSGPRLKMVEKADDSGRKVREWIDTQPDNPVSPLAEWLAPFKGKMALMVKLDMSSGGPQNLDPCVPKVMR